MALVQRVVVAAVLHHSIPADQLDAVFACHSRDPHISSLPQDVERAMVDASGSPGLKAACSTASQAARR